MKILATLVATALAAGSLLASAAARTPTNDTAAFRTFDLYADRTAAVNVVDHVNVSAYPSYLNSNSLLVTRTPGSSDTVALFNSEPYDGIYFEVNGSQPQSYVEYAVTPPQFATSLGFLAMGVIVFNGTGAFNDFGKPLLRATVTYADGDTAIRTLHVGNHVREYFDADFSCNFVNIPLYTARPSDPLSGYIYEDGTYFYDVQEQLLPGDRRNKKLTSIRIAGVLLDHFCSFYVPHIYSGSDLFGLSAWPEFPIVNRSSQQVALQKQSDPLWRNDPYGGFSYASGPVGTARTIWANGCFLTCVSMAHNYYGVACTPGSLNQWLQEHGGFPPQRYARLNDIGGQNIGNEVGFVKLGRVTLGTGRTFVVEQPVGNPLVTIEVLSTPGRGRIAIRHQPTAIDTGMIGYFHSYVANEKASKVFSGERWEIQRATSAELCEDALADSLPVMLNVRGGEHWVLADGREVVFPSSTSARGTYSIEDPAPNVIRLSENPYNNQFGNIRVCRRLSGTVPGPLLAATGEAATTVEDRGLVVFLDGPVAADLTDPIGRGIAYVPAEDEYASTIPDAIATRGWVVDDDLDAGAISQPVDVLEIPRALDGDYTLRVSGQGSGTYGVTANAYGASGTTASDGYTSEAPSAGYEYYRIQYSTTGTVVVQPLPPTGVDDHLAPDTFSLLAAPNPTRGEVRITFALGASEMGSVAIFDPQGRRVARLASGQLEAGPHVLQWSGRDNDGQPVRTGIYFIRLAVGDRVVLRRLVVAR